MKIMCVFNYEGRQADNFRTDIHETDFLDRFFELLPLALFDDGVVKDVPELVGWVADAVFEWLPLIAWW